MDNQTLRYLKVATVVCFQAIQPPHDGLDVHPDRFITHMALSEKTVCHKQNATLIGKWSLAYFFWGVPYF